MTKSIKHCSRQTDFLGSMIGMQIHDRKYFYFKAYFVVKNMNLRILHLPVEGKCNKELNTVIKKSRKEKNGRKSSQELKVKRKYFIK